VLREERRGWGMGGTRDAYRIYESKFTVTSLPPVQTNHMSWKFMLEIHMRLMAKNTVLHG
jgi:hypothetical protein